MFSWILEFISVVKKVQRKVQEEKTKRIKRKTKDEALKESDSIVEAHDKTKNSENVIEEEKKSKKLRVQEFFIGALKFVANLFDVSIMATLILIAIFIFFVALVVILIMFALWGFLSNNVFLPDGGIYSGSDDDCIQGTQALTQNNFQVPSQLGGTLTDQQKNIAISFGLYNDIISGKYGDINSIFVNKYSKVNWGEFINKSQKYLSTNEVLSLLAGTMSAENDFRFPGSSDILTIPCNTAKDGNNDAWLGLEADKGIFKGRYQYTYSNENYQLYSDDFVSKYTDVYKYDSNSDNTGNNPWKSLNNYVPYGIATQVGFMGLKYGERQGEMGIIDSELPKIAAEFGISANLDKLNYLFKYFIILCSYHGHNTSDTDNLMRFWCALWAASSDNDAERSFLNYELKAGYGEPSYRPAVLGCPCKYPSYNINGTVGQYGIVFALNGQDINVPLIKFAKDYCDSKGIDYSDVIDFLSRKQSSGNWQITNVHYLFIAYLSSMKAMSDIGIAAPVVTGGSIDDCDCYEGGSGSLGGTVNVGNRDFSNVKAGEIQGEYPEDIKNKMLKNTKLSQHFAKLYSLQNPDGILAGNVTYEQWRLNSKWQVPYQHQNSKIETWAHKVNFGGVRMRNKDGSAGAGNLCPLMTQSYIFSAMTGKAINVAEITALGQAEPWGSSGRNWSQICVAAGDYGFYMRTMLFNPISNKFSTVCVTDNAEANAPIIFPEKQGHNDVIEMINYVLDNNGIVGVNVRGALDTNYGGACGKNRPTSKFAGSNHYFVITHRVGDTYYTHTASKPSLDIVGHKIEDIIGTEGNALCLCWSCNLIFAYNPSLTVVDNTQAGGIQTGGIQTGGTQTGGTQSTGTQSAGTQTVGVQSSGAKVSSFENFLFIGDSFTVQLNSNLNSEMSKHIVMAAGGAYPDQYVKDSDADGKIDFLTTSITVGTGKLKDTVGPLPDNVNGVVVLIGTNQVTRNDQIEDTKVLLQTLVDKYDVPIYVQKVFPKGYYKDPINYHKNNGNYQWNADDENAATDKFNQEISNFCSSNSELNFIDTTAGLVENGYLKYTGDGLHLYTTEKTVDGRTTFEVWYENIKNAILNGASNTTSTNSSSVNCISSSNSGVSSAGAIDLDLDVDDVTAKIKAGSWGHSYSKTRTKDEIKFIVVHYWGSQSKYPAFALRKDSDGNESGLIHLYEMGKMNRESDGKTYMAQYVVDREGIYRTAPDLVNVQHAGGDYYNGGDYYKEVLEPLGMEKCTSNNSIGIEVSNSDLNDTGSKNLPASEGFYVYEKGAIENLISLTKALMIEYNIDVDHIYRHYDCSMKTCPAPFIDDKSLWVYNASDYDKGESQNWKAFKECLTSDTIDWSKFNDHVVDNIK